MSAGREQIIAALQTIQDPELGRSISDLGMVEIVEVDANGKARVSLRVSHPGYPHKDAIAGAVQRAVLAVDGVSAADVSFSIDTPSRQIAADDPVPEVKNVILVMSGKGGVGKSTVAANLALALGRMGFRVGLLDADIYGPSIPTMLGITGQPMSDGQKITPLQRFGIKLMSIGFLLEDPKSAIVWRGPMLHGALMQFLKDVAWGPLDYLLLDLPPGTGDVALTLSQKVRATGGVIVTTPQEVALQDVYKSVSMAQKVGIPVLGIVENESYFICDGCSKRHELFGAGGGEKVAAMAGAPLLGQIPLHPAVRQWGDAGTPVVQAAPGSEIAQAFVSVAERLIERVAEENLATSGGLVIDRTGGKNRHLPLAR
jgi:ATP-binding protein involved in chromosome partitioning